MKSENWLFVTVVGGCTAVVYTMVIQSFDRSKYQCLQEVIINI